jgi:hypothetical protein
VVVGVAVGTPGAVAPELVGVARNVGAGNGHAVQTRTG